MINVYVEGGSHGADETGLASVLLRLRDIAVVDDPALAEAILLTGDDYDLIRTSPTFEKFAPKCLAISDGDILSYYIPALYASNYRCLLSRGRAQTASPYNTLFENEHGKRNLWINRLKDSNPEKRLLYSFMGGSTCWVRKRLVKQYRDTVLKDVMVEATDHYRHWAAGDAAKKTEQQRRYVETMLSSKFAVCPRGASASSIRLFEAMELGVAPVVIADKWIPTQGVDWSFCLFVREARLGDLDAIIRSHSDEWRERGAAARQTFERNFSPAASGATLERQMRRLLADRDDNRERLIRAVYPFYRTLAQSKATARATLRGAVLSAYRLAGRKFPYELNR